MPEREEIINCRCGNRLANTETPSTGYSEWGKEDMLGASFVHLSKPSSDVDNSSIDYNHGFVATNNHVKTLLSISEARFDSLSSRTPFLCGSCISRSVMWLMRVYTC